MLKIWGSNRSNIESYDEVVDGLYLIRSPYKLKSFDIKELLNPIIISKFELEKWYVIKGIDLVFGDKNFNNESKFFLKRKIEKNTINSPKYKSYRWIK